MELKDVERFMKTTKDGKHYYEFNTLHELGDLIVKSVEENYCPSNWNKGAVCKASTEEGWSNKDFTKTDTMKEAIELLKYGWEHGTEKINSKLKSVTNDKSLKISYNVIGGQVSVPRMLQGLPTNMIKTKIIDKPVKVLNVYKSCAYGANYSADSIIENSTKALQIVELMEAKGYRVNLFVVKLNENESRDEEMFIKTKIKGSDERLNVKKTAFCLAHPAFQRRIMFRLLEINPYATKYWWTYGTPVDALSSTKMHDKYLKYMPEKNKIFIPIVIDNVNEFVKNIHLE